MQPGDRGDPAIPGNASGEGAFRLVSGGDRCLPEVGGVSKRLGELRRASIQGLEFPYPWRAGQKKLAMDVYRTILRKKNPVLQAPTGTGKTLSTVYPAVKAVGEGLAERIFMRRPRLITRTVAEEAFSVLRGNGLRLKTLTLTAKEKVCPCGEMVCNPDACPRAKGHFDRVNDAVFEMLNAADAFDRDVILQQAEKWRVCPFEMSLDVSLWCDAVICDYNYIFDPRAKLKRFFSEGRGEYLFLVDEAHNLVDRGREMFSAALYKEDFLEGKRAVEEHSRKLTRALERCNAWLLDLKRESTELKVHEDVGIFPVYLMNLCGQIEEVLEKLADTEAGERMLELYFSARSFLEVCDRLDDSYVIYSELCADGRFMLKLYCVDISGNLQECINKGRSTVFFSATLLPVQYYKSLLSTAPDNYAICATSTFQPEKRLILLGTDTSSRYTRRGEEEYRRIATYICEALGRKSGNYMVFSFLLSDDGGDGGGVYRDSGDGRNASAADFATAGNDGGGTGSISYPI
ncbi:MAG: ATP-dependent DNA helicase [Lachnospiraceae bacterium]